jgi:cardiolipin synthase A/B
MLVVLSIIVSIVATALVAGTAIRWFTTRKPTRPLIITAIASALFTLFATLLYANLTTPTSGIANEVTSDYGVDDPRFIRAMGTLLGPSFTEGNHVTSLLNGDQIFPSMLAAINGATKTICFETFIYWEGATGQKFADSLSAKARAGVAVHVLLDWLGSNRMEQKLLDEMKEAGVMVERYHPLSWYSLDRINNRTHRKILIVDGRIGFTGGVGIGDEWTGNAHDKDHWRDSHFRVEGPVVAQMQSAFLDNWMKTHAQVLHGDNYFPELPSTGTMTAQMFKSSAEGGSSSARLMFLMSIACARKTVHIGNSYFVPDDLTIKTLIDATARGVDVQIICPGPVTDTNITRNASRALWGDLLKAGVKIYEYEPTMFHCKYMVIDGIWSSVGSTNFDPRSFRLNDEANLNVLDAKFGTEIEQSFAGDKSKSVLITYEGWSRRPRKEKLQETVSSWLGPQL